MIITDLGFFIVFQGLGVFYLFFSVQVFFSDSLVFRVFQGLGVF